VPILTSILLPEPMILSGKSLIAGVIGNPVTHSLSPRLHGYWLQQYQIDGTYIPLQVAQEHLAEVIKALPKMGLRGVNITVPHKEAVMAMLDAIDPVAMCIGAVNTIIVEADGRLRGTNTDAYGFIENLKAAKIFPLIRNKAVILGAGGAARAIIAGLLDEGIGSIILLNRSRDKAEQLAAHFGAALQVKSWEARHEALAEAGLLVNTTLLGMAGQLPLDVQLDALPHDAVVTDIVYKPLKTPLLCAAEARGNLVVDGLGMLLHQAVKGFEAWYGVKPEVTDALREFVLV
jgi:shikimate dehydrogenase